MRRKETESERVKHLLQWGLREQRRDNCKVPPFSVTTYQAHQPPAGMQSDYPKQGTIKTTALCWTSPEMHVWNLSKQRLCRHHTTYQSWHPKSGVSFKQHTASPMYYINYIMEISNDKETEEILQILWLLPCYSPCGQWTSSTSTTGASYSRHTPTLLGQNVILTGPPVICMHTEVWEALL